MRLADITTPEFRSIIDGIVREISPVAVVCFGHTLSIVNYTSCFQATTSEHHHYDLLIVQSNSNHYKDHEIIDLVKNEFPDGLSVNVLSHSERSVLTAIQQLHPFFCRVFREGHVLYLAVNSPIKMDKIKTVDADVDQSKLAQECKRSFDLSGNFLAMASDALGSHLHDVAVFLLHQSMEQMCIASIKAHLKYRPTTHNLSKLIDLIGCYLPQVKSIFPCNTNDEQLMFDFLRRAYSDVRYKLNYRLPPHIAFSLLERVNEFQNLVEDKYNLEFVWPKV
ncbi:HEPN domain-containing protein [Ohtaekwangia koreensis]|uniref:HEPN domain-containing protein n=1 Tax=Ohtaekwangia koreensis TaxID=688867 RepID=A0A1T5J3A1_9BACT|nr:HEPN domain-containing protein [Ohtaekwangia koreensis]SKC45844.1 HEPN domain-containing protein [Ohtaekwangia koreensis]